MDPNCSVKCFGDTKPSTRVLLYLIMSSEIPQKLSSFNTDLTLCWTGSQMQKCVLCGTVSDSEKKIHKTKKYKHL